MTEYEKELVGARILYNIYSIFKSMSEIVFEGLILEISPSSDMIKIKSLSNGDVNWYHKDKIKILEVLDE